MRVRKMESKDDMIIGLKNEIEDLEFQIKDLSRYKKFVEHIYSHRHEIKLHTLPPELPLDEWVLCKICGKTIKELNLK